jgi:hypothetical protein
MPACLRDQFLRSMAESGHVVANHVAGEHSEHPLSGEFSHLAYRCRTGLSTQKLNDHVRLTAGLIPVSVIDLIGKRFGRRGSQRKNMRSIILT